jgi:hypothetical protein
MPDDQRAADTCEQCGQTDNHPKVHITDVTGLVTRHHDCLSAAQEEMVRGSSEEAGQIIDAAKGGTRGPKLLAHINKLHSSSKGK